MLYSFSVGNYLSFSEIQTLQMLPEPLKENKDYLLIPYLYDVDFRLLKSMVLYGHNSYGKSNFIKAYDFFRKTIFSSFVFGKNDNSINVDYFKFKEIYQEKPSFFEIIFLLKQTKYRYSFEILNGKVIKEELYYAEAKIRENYLFLRAEQEIRISKIWGKETGGIVDQSVKFTKSHNLFLSILLAQENINRIGEIGEWLKGNIIITDINNKSHLNKATLILTQAHYRQMIQKFIDNADLGFKTIDEKIDNYSNSKIKLEKDFIKTLFSYELETFEIYTQHNFFDKEDKLIKHIFFELLKNESAGSIKYLILSCYLTFAIKHGQLLLIDELDSQLHVELLDSIVKIFNSGKINALGAQMIFTSHNTSLLSDKALRRDQIVLVHKNEFGESSIHKMHSKNDPTRNDSPIDKKYLLGKIGISKNLKLKNKMPDLGFEE